ncbi:uncharacterized protein LOC134776789 [Penaeus indicus]|uniref:uncharacterized protein LOC134776789 n=1 Tax=Penaeus indicus TaxID=29960 RepID=UPI00300C19A7
MPRQPYILTGELFLEYSYNQLVVPKMLINTVLRLLASRSSVDKAMKTARSQYFFLHLTARVTDHVRKCQLCLLYKVPSSASGLALTYNMPTCPKDYSSASVSMSFQGFLSTANKRYFSLFCELVPIPDKSATSIACVFLENICRHNTLDKIISDNGTDFNSSLMWFLCNKFNFKKINVLPYRPQANDIIKMLNRKILKMRISFRFKLISRSYRIIVVFLSS